MVASPARPYAVTLAVTLVGSALVRRSQARAAQPERRQRNLLSADFRHAEVPANLPSKVVRDFGVARDRFNRASLGVGPQGV